MLIEVLNKNCDPMYVETYRISAIEPHDRGGSIITLDNGKMLDSRERPEQIYKKCKEASELTLCAGILGNEV